MICPCCDAICSHVMCVDCWWTFDQFDRFKRNLKLTISPLRKKKLDEWVEISKLGNSVYYLNKIG